MNTIKTILTNNKTIAAAALLTLSLTGCAITPATVNLSYQPDANISKIAGAGKVKVSVQVNDLRKDKSDVVAHKENMYGMHMANMKDKETVAVTVRHALEAGLQAKGFNVADSSPKTVVADLNYFYSLETDRWKEVLTSTGYQAAKIDMNVKYGNYSKNITGSGYGYGFIFGGANVGAAEESLNKSLADSVTKLIEDKAFTDALLSTANTEVSQPAPAEQAVATPLVINLPTVPADAK